MALSQPIDIVIVAWSDPGTDPMYYIFDFFAVNSLQGRPDTSADSTRYAQS